MGKGDKKTAKGKRFKGSFGNCRKRMKIIVKNNNFSDKKNMSNKIKIDELDRLYLLKQVFRDIVSEFERRVSNETEDVKLLENNIIAYKIQIELINSKVIELRKDFFQFSIEELYVIFGRYDKFISIDFHPNSESSDLFGKEIMGTLIFNRRQRQDINAILKQNPLPRTNSYVKIDPSKMSNLNEEQIHKLQTKGFLCGDILKVNHTAIDYDDKYVEKSKKEIPGTINIEFNPNDFNHELLALQTYGSWIKENTKPLIEAELDKYYAYMILYKKSVITSNEWVEKIYEKNTENIKESIRYFIYKSKHYRSITMTDEDITDFKKIIKKRSTERNIILDKEINRSSNKKLREIIESNKTAIDELRRIAYFYEEENLSTYGAKYPIYLDLERYLHIFIRHFEDFQVGDWKGGKTSFQYSFKDTKRLIEIVIGELQHRIDQSIEKEKEFKIYDLKAHYFNGNYYVVHVDKNGRLLAFYPHENE